MNPFYMERTGR